MKSLTLTGLLATTACLIATPSILTGCCFGVCVIMRIADLFMVESDDE